MDGGGSRAVGLPDFPRRNTRDFVRQLIQVQSQVRPMCRYIPPGRKLHTSTAKILIKHKLARVCVQPRQLICQHDTARICCWVPCCGPGLRRRCCWAPGVRRCRSIFCSAANLPNAAAAFEWWTDWLMDRWTDGRTDTRPFHRPCSACAQCQKANQIVKSPRLSLTEFSAKILSTLDTYRQALSNLTRSSYVSQDHLSVPKFYEQNMKIWSPRRLLSGGRRRGLKFEISRKIREIWKP